MASKTFWHSPVDSNYDEVIVKARVTRIRKHRPLGAEEDNEKITEIHLDDGTVVLSEDSIKTLDARLNSED